MDHPVPIDLHARHCLDVPVLQPLLHALRDLDESAELSVAEGICEVEGPELPAGPLPCTVRVLVDGRGSFPSVPAEPLFVLPDTLELRDKTDVGRRTQRSGGR